ncbi:MAG: hypothetical protein F6K48_14325 [Okeania sp. SIO3H1]|uniref:hypothetical protein n=1 Tax=Okeania sp. SIO1I7 TaxID=2607772 RepID=UPI0013CB8121|nr:hypothetical protein [Okeania sp. SIO1I7]NEN90022.1 hypothetical protein [Okeania sp. SIO3H1]NET24963.1 hypothetical protein [Okeania sp. SIO1I7]
MFHFPHSPVGTILPIRLFHQYGNELALWFYCRWIDKEGSGRAVFDIKDAAEELCLAASTLRKWLCEGKRMELWRYYSSKEDIVTIYYTSSHRLAASAGLKGFGPVLEVEHMSEVANHRLTMLATQAETADLQAQSRFAAHCEAIARTAIRLHTEDLKKARKYTPKPLKPNEIISNPVTNLARVLWKSGIQLGVSEGFIVYGASQASVADRRGVCLRTVNRHLSNSYRTSESPVRGFRGCIGIERVQINRRLNRDEGKGLEIASIDPGLWLDARLNEGKVWRNAEGRWFERFPCIYEEMASDCRLRKVKFRRSRLERPTQRHKQHPKEYWIDKKNLLKEN